MRAAPPAAPVGAVRAETEALLLDIWRRVLGVAVGRDDNFFDCGGDSLLAVNLFLEVEQQTGVGLPITAIYDAQSVAAMASLIAEEAACRARHATEGGGCDTGMAARMAAGGETPVPGAYAPLVLLKSGTGKCPLYIVHGIGGTVIELAALGRQVRVPEAVYAIQARGLDGRNAPHETIEDMVDHYVQIVRAVQPSGPYRLCGYSFGGLIAMEMARRLRAQGQSVGALILMDAYAHPSTWPLSSRLKMKLRRAIHLFRRSPVEALSRVFRGAKHQSESSRLHEWLLDHNPALPAPLLRVREAGGAALRAYRPKPYAGRIVFLHAGARDIEFPDDPKRIWRRLALNIAFRTIPGAHRTIVTAHAETSAAALTECLASHTAAPRVASPVRALRAEGGAKHRRGQSAYGSTTASPTSRGSKNDGATRAREGKPAAEPA